MDRYIGVDASSSDGSIGLLRDGLPPGTPLAETSARGFGHSVRVGLDGRLPPAAAATQDWIWLIHDDSAPAEDALERLLAAVETAPSVTIAGCKQLDRDAPRRLLDIGLSISRWGERLAMIDVDELDQGQHDRKTDSFAVNSAGMLVRRDAWEHLEGFDEALPGIGDDLDLCWRNRLAGHRVVVVPRARMFHAADTVRSVAGPVAARRAEVHLRLKHAPLWKLPFVTLGVVLGGVLGFVSHLVAKDPGYAVGQLGASLGGVLRPVRLAKSRRAASRTRTVPRKMVRPLLVPYKEVRSHRRHLLEGLESGRVHGDGSGSTSQASNPSGDNNDDFAALAAPQRTSAGVGAVLAVGATLAVSLIGLRALVGAPALAGGSLLPLSAEAGDIWSNATGWWQSLGSGHAGHGDPFDAVLWMLSMLGLGHANAAAVVLVLAAMPLAAFFAWISLGAVTASRSGRLLGATAWGLSPSLQVALGSGRPGAIVVHVLLPLVVLGAIRSVGAARSRHRPEAGPKAASMPRRPGVNGVASWTAAAGSALALAACTAAAPLLLPVALVATLVLALTLGRGAKTLWWIPVPSLALAAPTLAGALANPRLLLVDPGVPMAFSPAPLWQQALGFPIVFDAAAPVAGLVGATAWAQLPWAGIAAALVGVPLVLLAAVGLFRIGRIGWIARTAWFAGLAGLAVAFLAQLAPATLAGGVTTTAFTGPFVSLFGFGILLAAAVGYDALREGRAGGGPRFGAARSGFAVAVVLLTASCAVAGSLWLAPRVSPAPPVPAAGSQDVPPADFGAAQQVVPASERTLPATAADRGTGRYEDRTLVVSRADDGGVSATLMGGTGTTLDELSGVALAARLHGDPLAPDPTADDDATAAVRSTVASLMSGQSIDPRAELQELGVAFVVLQQTDTASDVLAGQLDSVPGLAPVGRTGSGWLWRVQADSALAGSDNPADFTGRVRLVDADGATTGLVPSRDARVEDERIPNGGAGRMVVLAERADQGWRATLDGRPLTPTAVGWAQAFELPQGAGVLDIRYDNPWALPVALLQGVVFGSAVLLALPIPQRRRSGQRRHGEYRTGETAAAAHEPAAEPTAEPARGQATDLETTR